MYDRYAEIDLERRQKMHARRGGEPEYPVEHKYSDRKQLELIDDARKEYEAYHDVWGDTVPDFGFRLQRPSNRIGWVASGSLAEHLGLKVGDEIIHFRFSGYDVATQVRSSSLMSRQCSTAAQVEAALRKCTADINVQCHFVRGGCKLRNTQLRALINPWTGDPREMPEFHRAFLGKPVKYEHILTNSRYYNETTKAVSDAHFPSGEENNSGTALKDFAAPERADPFYNMGFGLADTLLTATRILKHHNLPTNNINGHHVTEIYPGSAAEEAGLRVGDEIVAVEGIDVRWQGPAAVHQYLFEYYTYPPLYILLQRMYGQEFRELTVTVARGRDFEGTTETVDLNMKYVATYLDLYLYMKERYRRAVQEEEGGNGERLETEAEVKERGRETYVPFNPSAQNFKPEFGDKKTPVGRSNVAEEDGVVRVATPVVVSDNKDNTQLQAHQDEIKRLKEQLDSAQQKLGAAQQKLDDRQQQNQIPYGPTSTPAQPPSQPSGTETFLV